MANPTNPFNSDLPFSQDIDILKQPLQIGEKTIPNRLVCQPMEGCDGTLEGRPGSLTQRRYGRFAAGGSGLIWVEATAVTPEARANPRQLWLNPTNVDSFKKLVEMVHETAYKAGQAQPLLILQATHSGRYSKPYGFPKPIIAYNNPLFEKQPLPSSCIITDDELDRLPEKMAATAKLAQQCGFDGVDIKSCHRYLFSELLSAFNRSGRYGGSFDNRTRLLTESITAAIQGCPSSFIVTSRLNVYDGFPFPYGFGVREGGDTEVDLSEPIRLIEKLQSLGVGLLNITMGNPYVNPHVNRPYKSGGYTPDENPIDGVKRILDNTAILQRRFPTLPLIASGLSLLAEQAPPVAAGLIAGGGAAMAGFGRMSFAYPDFAKQILANPSKPLDASKCCIACSKCSQLMRAGGMAGCVIKDSEVYLPIFKQYVLKGK